MADEKRRDTKGRLLYNGESQAKDGRYVFKYTDIFGKRRALYSWRLTKKDPILRGNYVDLSLREKEKKVLSELAAGIGSGDITVLELVDRYIAQKTGVKHNTQAGYKTVRNILEKETFGYRKIDTIKISDAKLFLIKLQNEDYRSYSSIHSIRGVLRPAFQMAVDDDRLLKNPFEFQLATIIINDSVMREAISRKQEREFLSFVKNDPHFSQYYGGIYVLFKTGMRIAVLQSLTLISMQKLSTLRDSFRKRGMGR